MNRFPPRRILVAADLSAAALTAVDAAKELAQQWGAAIEIVSVELPPMIAAGGGYDGKPWSALPPMPEAKREMEARLRAAAGGFPAARLKLRTVQGWPPSALLELARPERADMMVMGTHGYAGLDRLVTGSVAEAVIRRAQIPVLAVPETAGVSEVARVLAPWNGRPYATHALRWARELARSLCATLDVLHVDEPGVPFEGNREGLDERLSAILGGGTDWVLHARKGEARRVIVEEANSGHYELVVLSAHRRSFAEDFALGSTVERLLRHAAVPVLGVPSGGARPRLMRRVAARAAETAQRS
jgi:nucleotide-binding universal stress UspA family protein